MAGWPILTNGSASEFADIIRVFRRIGFCLDINSQIELGPDDCSDKLRCTFDQILSVFLKEVVNKECIRPCPAMLGDGRAVDLFKLFWFVRKRGGYDAVSKNNTWASVLEDCGFDAGVTASVKLIYFKYLYQLDLWMGRLCKDKSSENVQRKYDEGFDILSLELGTKFKGSLANGRDCEAKNDNLIQLEPFKNGRSIVLNIEKSEQHTSAIGNESKMDCSTEESLNDDDEKYCSDDDGLVTTKQRVYSRKRKRGPLFGMLKWITQIAKQPSNVVALKDPTSKDHASKEYMKQALLAREARLLKRQIDSDAEQNLLQKKLKMHPSMYEDRVLLSQQSREGLRCRLLSKTKSHICTCCKPHSATESVVVSPQKAESEAALEEHETVTSTSLATPKRSNECRDNPFKKLILVGPLYQAEVPDWTGELAESDSKWLGARIWPLESERRNIKIETDSVGKGRQDRCDCQLPGSVNCVRFHTAEKRMKLKLELGAVFFIWRFNRMGEEVSLSWTIEEEKKFKNVVRLNPPSLGKSFWDDAFKCFPMRSRKDLVSYYFNAYLVHRRSYQNRVTPKDIDSDDENESEFGSFGDGYGIAAVKIPGSTLQLCNMNKQCFDLNAD